HTQVYEPRSVPSVSVSNIQYTAALISHVSPEMVVGWYHSHPGFGCWLSGVDINTQQSFEALNPRAVAVVIDPIQSVKGKVVIDAFRLINPQTMMLGQEPRQTTSNVGHLNKPSIHALIHGLNRHYYSIAINYQKNELEEKMLLNLHKKKWTDGLILKRFDTHSKTNKQTVQEMLNLAIKYNKAVQEEDELPPEKLAIANVGLQDAKKHLEEHVWLGKIIVETCISHIAASAPMKRTFRKYSYRDIDLDTLLNMSTDDLVQLFLVDAWRSVHYKEDLPEARNWCGWLSEDLWWLHLKRFGK
ncbi:hypothetical protein ACJX0J_023590, partial [Zea mays]